MQQLVGKARGILQELVGKAIILHPAAEVVGDYAGLIRLTGGSKIIGGGDPD